VVGKAGQKNTTVASVAACQHRCMRGHALAETDIRSRCRFDIRVKMRRISSNVRILTANWQTKMSSAAAMVSLPSAAYPLALPSAMAGIASPRIPSPGIRKATSQSAACRLTAGLSEATQRLIGVRAQRVHAIDPQWRQDVICGAALDEMRWGAVGG
jgi:hypothetical protein